MCLQAGKGTPGRVLYVVSIAPILLSLQAQDGKTGGRPQLWPPPAAHRPDPLLPLHLTLKAVVKELCPSPSLVPPLLLISRESPSICEPEGEDTCDQKPVTWQPSQKAFMPVARQGAGIYFPHHPLPVSSSRPLAPPRSLKEIHRPCFLSCLPLPELGKQYSTKERKRTSCPFVRCAGQRCCLLHSTAWFLFNAHRLFLMETK